MDTTMLAGLIGAAATIAAGIFGVGGAVIGARESSKATLRAAREAWAQSRKDQAADAGIAAFSEWVGHAAEAVSAQNTAIPWMQRALRIRLKGTVPTSDETQFLTRGMDHAVRTGAALSRMKSAAMRLRLHSSVGLLTVGKVLHISNVIAAARIDNVKTVHEIDAATANAMKELETALDGINALIRAVAPPSTEKLEDIRIDVGSSVRSAENAPDELPANPADEHANQGK